MFRKSISRIVNSNYRTYTTHINRSTKETHSLAEEALAQKTGTFKATLPKGDKKPSKATGTKDNTWKHVAIGTSVTLSVIFGGLVYYGRPLGDDKFTNENLILASYHRSLDRFREFRQEMHQPMWKELLPDPLPEPYRRPYTLVINLDETLVYSTWSREHGWRHAKRPGVDYFLSYLSQFYEIVIFTSQPAMNAMPILDKLDPYQYAMYRLYRDGTRYVEGHYIKDLSHLNRDLSKVIIMDSNPQAFSMQPENGVTLKPWKGEPDDHGLIDYIPFLEAVALTNPTDIRPVLSSFGDTYIPAEWAKREEDMNEQHRQQWLAEQKNKPSNRNLGSWLGSGGGGSSSSSSQGTQEPPPTYLEQMRRHVRETYAQEHEAMKVQQDQMMKDMEMQKEKMKEMKMTVWELMSQVSSGQPILPPGQEPPQQQQQSTQQQPQQPGKVH